MKVHGLWLLLLAGLAACGERGGERPDAATQAGIDRSVADVAAAEAATRIAAAPSRTVGELTGRKPEPKAPTRPEGRTGTPAADKPGPAEEVAGDGDDPQPADAP